MLFTYELSIFTGCLFLFRHCDEHWGFNNEQNTVPALSTHTHTHTARGTRFPLPTLWWFSAWESKLWKINLLHTLLHHVLAGAAQARNLASQTFSFLTYIMRIMIVPPSRDWGLNEAIDKKYLALRWKQQAEVRALVAAVVIIIIDRSPEYLSYFSTLS